MTERLHFQFSVSCIGEGNGNPLQCACLENPRDGRAWWAAVYGVAQSWTRRKWLNSSSSSSMAVPVLVFWKTSILFSTVTVQIYLSTNGVQGVTFLHTFSQTFIICGIFFKAFFLKNYLFLWLNWVFLMSCGIFIVSRRISHCGIPTIQLWHAGSLVVMHRLWSMRAQLWCMGLVAPWHVGF